MASQPPPLPPTSLVVASAKAKMDQIAVRIINMPDGLRSPAQPSKLSGTVSGQNNDGSLNIKTEGGEIRILLSDKGNLPQGLKIDIEIPAGRSPQQAFIKQNDILHLQQKPSVQPSQPSLITTIRGEQGQPIPPPSKIQSETLSNVIASTQTINIDKTALPVPLASGTLQAGQLVRLNPVPPGSIPQAVIDSLVKPSTIPDMIMRLVGMIEKIPLTETQLRINLISLLSKIDLSSLSIPKLLPNGLPLATSAPDISQLLKKIDGLFQSIGLPIMSAPPLKNVPVNPALSTNIPSSLALFNPSKSVDGQIISFGGQPSLALVLTMPQQENFLSPQFKNAPVSPAQILGFSQNGLPILSVPLPNTGLTQIFTMQFKADNISAGAPLFIALDPSSTKPTQVLFLQSADGTISLNQTLSPASMNSWINSGSWDSLDDLLKNLSHISPPHAQSFANMIPSPSYPQAMGSLSLFFLSLMRSGDTDGWVANEAVALLRQMGKSDALRAVNSDMALTSKIENLSLPQDWKMTLLPLLWENQIYKTPLYYKHFSDEENKQDAEDKKRRRLRFLFDLNLSRMGGVQVDGFMQSERLDIILRTKTRLSPPMQNNMKKIYAGAMDKSRLTGELSFQFKPEHWVDLLNIQEKTGIHA